MSEAALTGTRSEDLTGTRVVRLRIPARFEYVGLARLAIGGLAHVAGLEAGELADLKLALTEVVSDSLCAADGAGHVSITYELSAVALTIDVDGTIIRQPR